MQFARLNNVRWWAIVAAWLLIAVSLRGATHALLAAEPISLAGFGDGARHWRDGQDRDGYPAYAPEDITDIADNLLRYQRVNGGWPKNFDPLRILSEVEREQVADQRQDLDTTFDNRATYPEVEYLAQVFARTQEPRYREAVLHGIDFILSAQYANGGWPHTYPDKKDYFPRITIVDDVMVGILATLRTLESGQGPYAWIAPEPRAKLRQAIQRGDECLLAMQVRQGGKLTGWAAQYDEVTLQPAQGRTFELPALISSETVGVLKYLMRIEPPTPEVRRAVEGGVAWLEAVKISGWRIERVAAEPVRYQHHTSRDDLVMVADPAALPLWARFYDLKNNEPVLANRDGKRVQRLADMQRERRTGYSWYGGYATKLLKTEYPQWREKWSRAE